MISFTPNILDDRYKLDACVLFSISKEEADTLFGGFREYTPFLYEQEKPKEDEIRIAEIFNNKQ